MASVFLRGVVDTVIPHRMKDGTAFNEPSDRGGEGDGIDTVITCDNGICGCASRSDGRDMG